MRRVLIVLALASLPMVAAGAERDAGKRVGDDTRAWMALQQSGKAAAAAVQPMPGEVADKVYRRYLDSFSRPIPERYGRESFTSGSGGD